MQKRKPSDTMGTLAEDTLRTGAIASAATTAAAALLGQMENGSAVAPINAVSHIIWGDGADTEEVDARHTAMGLALNTAAITSWAGMHESILPRARPTVSRALLTGAATAVVAYVTDYYVVPKRFTPGFEKQLSKNALFGVYAVLAIALAVGSLSRSAKVQDEE